MRKLIFPLALLASLALATSALAATKAAKFDLGFTTKKPGKSTGFSFDVAFANKGGNGVPAALNKFSISLPKGSKFDGAGAPQCKATDKELNEKQSAACPANTFIGGGTASAVPAGGGNPIKTTVKIANGKTGRFEFFFAVGGTDVTGFRATTKGRKLTSPALTGTLPGGIIVTSLKGSIAKKSKGTKYLITTPKTCPKSRKWKFSGNFKFADGTDKPTDTVRCRA